jgi:xanthine dehydrogenase molybdopterin-binding subunit B
MENIEKVVKKDKIDVRIENMSKDESNIQNMIEDMKVIADFEERKRKVEELKKENRWRKRGIEVVKM